LQFPIGHGEPRAREPSNAAHRNHASNEATHTEEPKRHRPERLSVLRCISWWDEGRQLLGQHNQTILASFVIKLTQFGPTWCLGSLNKSRLGSLGKARTRVIIATSK
jgi:hypothetical protein